MQILRRLGMCFDAAVVFFKIFFTFIQIGSSHTVAEGFRQKNWVICQSRTLSGTAVPNGMSDSILVVGTEYIFGQ
jgi:hypothetical protein